MPMMAAGAAPAAAAAAEPEEEQTEFTVVLKEIGPKKIEVIKVVRSLTNLGLKEAKELVEGAPSNVMEAVSKEVAGDAKGKLEGAGAVIEVK
jgi:large subunit ribosomal protein L7/L12